MNTNKVTSTKQSILLACSLALFFSTQDSTNFVTFLSRGSLAGSSLIDSSVSVAILSVEITLLLIAIAFNRQVEVLFQDKKWPTLAASVAGLISVVMLLFYEDIQSVFTGGVDVLYLALGVVLFAAYSTVTLFVLILKVVQMELEKIGFFLGFVGILYSVVSLARQTVQYSDFVIMVASCLSVAAVIYFIEINKRPEKTNEEQDKKVSKSLLGLFFLCVVLCVIADVAPRLFGSTEEGASVVANSLVMFGVEVTVLAGLTAMLYFMKLSRKTLSLSVGLCIMVLIVCFLIAILLFVGGSIGLGREIIKANEAILQIVILILAAYMINTRCIKPIPIISLYAIFVLDIPLLVVKLFLTHSNVNNFIYAEQITLIAVAVVITIAVVVLAFVIIFVDMSNAKKDLIVDPEKRDLALCEAVARGKGLTPREFEVLVFLHRGYSIKKTAECMYISSSTVQSHIANVYKKLEVHSRQELIDEVDKTVL